MKRIFKIKVTKWLEHNKNHKTSFKKTQIANNFCTDAKLLALPLGVRWMYLGLLLECGNSNNETITMSERQLNQLLTIRLGVDNALAMLESLQLVTSEEVKPVIQKLNEIKRKESKLKEKKVISGGVQAPPPAQVELLDDDKPKNDPDANREVFLAYKQAYFERHKVEVKKDGTLNSQISQLVKRIGKIEAIQLVKFYLTHNDAFYLKNMHTFGHCLKDVVSLRTQMLKGVRVTSADVRNYEKMDSARSQIERIRSMGGSNDE